MKEPSYNIYTLSDEREDIMWRDAIFVFDSSALLDFYFLPLETRTKIFNQFETKLKDRLWIPNHANYEYNKNRERIIEKPITENYKPLKDDNLRVLKNSIKELENKIIDLKNKTEKDDKHPHLPQKEIIDFLEKISSFKKESENFEDSLIKQIIKIEEEIKTIPKNDDVLKAVNSLFKIGRYYTFKEILKITKEGKFRYNFSIPPGYEDAKNKEKKGTQIFGDLIIWKQIIEFATLEKKTIILICNDLKEDWCYLQKNSEKRIESPREELIKEIYDSANVEFWMYNQAQFLHNFNKYFDAKIEKQKIDNLSHLLAKKNKTEKKLIFECANCGERHTYSKEDLELDFEFIGSNERSMGPENIYQATEFFVCENCGNEITIGFDIWEYPMGIHNYDDIETDGAILIDSFNYTIDFFDDGDRIRDVCQKCGNEFKDERQIGICEKCDEEYNDK